MAPNVLIIIDTAAVGGPGKGILQLLRHVSPDEAGITVATFSSSRHRSSEFLDRLQAEGRRVAVLHERNRFDPAVVRQAAAVARDLGADIVQSHGYKGHLLCALLRRSLKIPWLAVVNGYTSENMKVRMYNSLDKITLRYCDAVVGVSPELCQRVKRLRRSDRDVYLIANAVDCQDLKGSGDAAALDIRRRCAPNGELLLGVIGRLSPEKGQNLLIEAFAAVRDQLPPCRILFVGEGPQRKDLEIAVRACGLQQSVVFEGYQTSVFDYFKAIDLLVLPSFIEGLPNAVLEAMVYGVPVISSAVGGVPNLIENGRSGWLFRPGDAIGLQQCLRQALLRDRARWNEITARAYIALYPRYSPRRRAERFLAVYSTLLEHACLNQPGGNALGDQRE